MDEIDRQQLQEAELEFPYHWLPRLGPRGEFSLGRSLTWGLEYLTYMDFIVGRLADDRPSSILDVGCGDGRLFELLSRRDPALAEGYWGIDRSSQAIALARALNRCDRFSNDPIGALGGRFSAVLLIEVLEHVPEPAVAPLLRSAAECLEDEGRLWLCVPSDNLPVSAKHERHYNRELLLETLARGGFEPAEIYFLCRNSLVLDGLRRLMANRLYTLNSPSLSRWIWHLNRRLAYFASAKDCRHLVVKARPIRR